MIPWERVALAVGSNILLALFAYLRRSVTFSGAVAGFFIGLFIVLGGGMAGWLVLLGFFIPSSLLSRIGKEAKVSIDKRSEKGSTRDAVQALANAGIPALMMIGYIFLPSGLWIVAFVSGLASAAGDTWSSELGVLSHRSPINLLTFRRVEPGTSGGVSLVGSLAAIAGLSVVILSSLPLWFQEEAVLNADFSSWLAAILSGALLGNISDSLLGAGLQARWLDADSGLSEKPSGTLVRGVSWINNDVVNALSVLVASSSGVLVYLIMES